jgi:two-component system sensor histidine kinase KdpD
MSGADSGSSIDAERGRFPWLTSRTDTFRPRAREFRFQPYLLALSCVAGSTLVAFIIEPYASLEDEAMIYLLGVMLAALRFDMRVSIFATLGSILACDFLFIPPRMAFAWTDARKTLTFLAMIVVAAVISGLSERLRYQEKVARRAAAATNALYELNVDLSGSGDPRHLSAVTSRRLQRLFGGDVLILLRTAEGTLESAPTDLSREELALVEQAWTGGDLSSYAPPTGYSTWLPVLGIHEPLAVIGLKVGMPFEPGSEHTLLLSAFARELATAIERTQLAKAAHRSQLDAETERMRSSLLSAVSHDLKTPLAGIVAAGTTLLEQQGRLDAATSRGLLCTIVGEGERLGNLIQNLLSMSRLESPTIDLRRSPEAVEDIVAAALDRLRDALAERQVTVEMSNDLPWVLAEPALIEQVLLNLLENALRYTPPHSSIEVAARASDGVVKVQVSDTGPGVAVSEREKVFEKFFRGSHSGRSDGGAGLGLTICRAIIHAHGGRIAIREHQSGGTVVEFTLPVTPVVAARQESMKEGLA